MNRISKTILTVLLGITTTSATAQDLIARQAPADKKLKDIQLIQFNTTHASEAELDNPASSIYTDWTRTIRNAAGSVPDNYRIDLRGFHMPTPSRKINSKFGRRWGRRHEGIDVKVYLGDTIRAAFDGKVRIVEYNARGYGYYVVIRHPNGLETLYGHLSKQLVKEDQIVRAGDVIGLGGNTGRSFGSHLHFETRLLGEPINPAFLFDFENQDVTGDYYVVNRGMTRQSSELANGSNSSRRASATRSTHRVRSGENLSSIAKKHGTTVAKLRRLNGLRRSSVIRPGQVLRIS